MLRYEITINLSELQKYFSSKEKATQTLLGDEKYITYRSTTQVEWRQAEAYIRRTASTNGGEIEQSRQWTGRL